MIDTKAQIQEQYLDVQEQKQSANPTDSLDKKYLNPKLVKVIDETGFMDLSSTHKKIFLSLILGTHIIAQVQSEKEKIVAFSIRALELVDPLSPNIQVVILSPTRTLANQISSVIKEVFEYMKSGIGIEILSGGRSVPEDIKKLKKGGLQVAVGTLQRLTCLLKKKVLRSEYIKMFIIDEADELLSRGFKDQLTEICLLLRNDVQIALFSATMSEEILKLSSQLMRDPVKILSESEKFPVNETKQ